MEGNILPFDHSPENVDKAKNAAHIERFTSCVKFFVDNHGLLESDKYLRDAFGELRHFVGQWNNAITDKAKAHNHMACEMKAWEIWQMLERRLGALEIKYPDKEKTPDTKAREAYINWKRCYTDLGNVFGQFLESFKSDKGLSVPYIASTLHVVQGVTHWLNIVSKHFDEKLANTFRHLIGELMKLKRMDTPPEGWREHCDDLKTLLLQLMMEVDTQVQLNRALAEKEKVDPSKADKVPAAEVSNIGLSPNFINTLPTKLGTSLNRSYLASEIREKVYEMLFQFLLKLLNTLTGQRDNDMALDTQSVFLFQYIQNALQSVLPQTSGSENTQKFFQNLSKDIGRTVGAKAFSDSVADNVDDITGEGLPPLQISNEIVNFASDSSVDLFLNLCTRLGWLKPNIRDNWEMYRQKNEGEYHAYPNKTFFGWLKLPTVLGKRRFEIAHRFFSQRYALRAIIDGVDIASYVDSGGMGEIWKGADESKVPWAVKILTRKHQRAMFMSEINIGASIQPRHDHIVFFRSAGTISDHPYMIVEFVIGSRNLKDLVQEFKARNEPLPLEMIVRLIAGSAAGLAHMHHLDRPVIHRDIKPENIMISQDGLAKICDFGLAGHLNPQAAFRVGGTPPFIPPELGDIGLERLDSKSDVYQLAGTMYALLTFKAPKRVSEFPEFETTSHTERQKMIVEYFKRISREHRDQALDTQTISDRYPGIPQAFLDILLRAMDPDPAKRPEMIQFLLELMKIFPQWFADVSVPTDFDPTNRASVKSFVKSVRCPAPLPSRETTTRVRIGQDNLELSTGMPAKIDVSDDEEDPSVITVHSRRGRSLSTNDPFAAPSFFDGQSNKPASIQELASGVYDEIAVVVRSDAISHDDPSEPSDQIDIPTPEHPEEFPQSDEAT